MTLDRRQKRLVRTRMTQTGEPYNVARRKLIALGELPADGDERGPDAGQPGPVPPSAALAPPAVPPASVPSSGNLDERRRTGGDA